MTLAKNRVQFAYDICLMSHSERIVALVFKETQVCKQLLEYKYHAADRKSERERRAAKKMVAI